ncbi:aa3-type cytochrome oxidase subunit IV [Corynebacterium bovis]|uniref:Cytochrome c oxidase polypeptide 4 n=2 Tax=Corynebacterium bovis TaxID=36808 RepID=A0A3R8QR72_9CORY|nr:cytochrome c oxidase subunit 4 [Corynebacterium bovis]MBB3115018.1 hypothetical protein [Corynebacterium bovis DSM 20582 = CIP 54.80]MDK8510211.1 cytochrome c oxidase subunit 4 [Corynebacterium bovis]MDN8578531.1 cytochrome c oxidase subunit 4 [Corynebacterium bovis]QQC47996.1 cytochrome c oxidase subunit 4 [Corynebacterium bovis]RRO82016.1 cytochrome-c oxidase [Corynebacterium bovis]
MNSASKIFYGLSAFFVVMTVFYFVATGLVSDPGSRVGIEWAGGTALALATLLSLMLAAYLHLTDSKSDIAPHDWEEAEIEDGAGVLGFFSASSIWPFAMTCGVAVIGYGIAFWHLWMIVAGAVILIWAATKLNLQYGVPPEKH